MITPLDLQTYTLKIINILYTGKSQFLIHRSHVNLTKYGNNLVKKNKLNQSKILEIGSGNGELFKHVNKKFSSYQMTDISSWGAEEIRKLIIQDERITFETADVEKLQYENDYFDRILLTCVMAHLTEPFKAAEELRRVTKSSGLISIFVTADPSVLLRIIRKIFVSNKMKKLGIPYKLWTSIEHRNNPMSLIEIIKYVFKDDVIKIKYYPFRLKSWNLSTHIVIHIIKQ
jgi:ubiquinone/menaquinone biosynthesis C-methylase UbiE